MANPTIGNVDKHFVRPRLAALDRKRSESGFGVLGGVGGGGKHGEAPFSGDEAPWMRPFVDKSTVAGSESNLV
jgi:hypothetical protein